MKNRKWDFKLGLFLLNSKYISYGIPNSMLVPLRISIISGTIRSCYTFMIDDEYHSYIDEPSNDYKFLTE